MYSQYRVEAMVALAIIVAAILLAKHSIRAVGALTEDG